VTETTGVPAALLSNCDYKTKHLSSACSCLGPATAAAAPIQTSAVSIQFASI
jgi:polygalacturonase